MFRRALILAAALLCCCTAKAQLPKPKLSEPFVAVDLDVGELKEVTLPGGQRFAVKLVDLQEHRDSLRDAVRRANVKVEVGGQAVILVSATYHLPTTVGNVRIDSPITK